MIFLKESLYGWGVCNIPQPRAMEDIFDDRRTSPHGPVPVERRLYVRPVGIWATWAAMVKRDLPVLQVFSVLAVSLCMIILFGLASFYLPAIVKQDPPLIEILAMVLEETAPSIPPVAIETTVTLAPQPEVRPEKPAVPSLPKPLEPPPLVVLAPPPKILSALPPKVVSLPDRPVENTVLPGPRTIIRQYQDAVVIAGPMPIGKPSATFDRPMPQKSLIASSSLSDRYDQVPGAFSAALPARKQAGIAIASATEVDLPSNGGMQGNFKMAHAVQSLRGTGSAKTFVPGQGGAQVAIRGSSGVGGNFAASGVQVGVAVETPGGGKRSAAQRVGMIGGADVAEVPILVGSGKASGSLGGTHPTASSPTGEGMVTGNVSFDGVGDGHYDPARMISLNQLNACIDPNAEWPLKTSLAAALDTDGKCSIRNMVFFFQNPENSYTLQVGVFNPEKFVDRCEALRTAIQCINP